MSRLPDEIKKKKKKKKKKHLIFPEIWPFENLSLLNLSARYIKKNIWASGLKLGQLIGDDE